MPSNRYKGITQRTRQLLNKAEGYDVEFKRNSQNLKGEDFVAFANSPRGGTILIGVDEGTDENGQQIGVVVGCSVGDETRLAINSKCNSCSPPVPIDIIIENENRNPFLRVEIASGGGKPYCTSGGKYTVRNDNQNVGLKPQELLKIYVAEEYSDFLEKFQTATKDLEAEFVDSSNEILTGFYNTIFKLSSELEEIESSVDNSIDRISDKLDETESKISDSIDSVEAGSEELFDHTSTLMDNLTVDIEELSRSVNYNLNCLQLIMQKLDIEEPRKTEAKAMFKAFFLGIKKIYSDQKRLTGPEDLIKEVYEKFPGRKDLYTKDELIQIYQNDDED